jgi:hypothetical protein
MSMTPTGDGGGGTSKTDAVFFVDDKGQPVQEHGQGAAIFRPAGLDPHFFVNQGIADQKMVADALKANPNFLTPGNAAAVSGSAAYELNQLAKFNQGHEWDAQRIGGHFHPEFVDYATVAIGLYADAAGITENQILSIENNFALLESHYPPGTPMDSTYTHLPERNVANTDLGYQLVDSGRIQPT